MAAIYQPTSLRQLRYNVTYHSNTVKRQIAHLLDTSEPLPANCTAKNGLPTWWPFWSDALVGRVRDAVRAARAVEVAEQHRRAAYQYAERVVKGYGYTDSGNMDYPPG